MKLWRKSKTSTIGEWERVFADNLPRGRAPPIPFLPKKAESRQEVLARLCLRSFTGK